MIMTQLHFTPGVYNMAFEIVLLNKLEIDCQHNKPWLKKMDSISYVYISWTTQGIWMIYITVERGDRKFSNTTARALA